MSNLFDRLDEIRRSGRRATMATLVATRGTSPRKEGARMWVSEDAAIVGSVTIGGCVDAEVVRAAEEVLRGGAPKLLSIELGDEDAHALGLTCAGAVDVLVSAVRPDDDAETGAWEAVRAHVAQGGRAVTVTVLPAADAPGGTIAAPLVVFDEGAVLGTLGADGLDAEARELALDRMRRGGSRTLTLRAGAAPVDAFFEVHGIGPLLAIVGAGEISETLTLFGDALGMHIVLLDARSRFASAERFPHAHEVHVGMPSEMIAARRWGPESAIVLVAHDYKTDLPVLEAALATEACYIGMLGSRRRGASILRMLAEKGASQEDLARIRTPIGLDIGSQSAAEIALSIIAEVVAVRSGRSGGALMAGRPT